MTNLLLITTVVMVACVLFNKISNKLGVPILLAFILVGMIFGSDGAFKIQFDNYALSENICLVALIFIMFYGGFGTNWKQAKPVALKAMLLSSFGTILTALFVGLFCHYILKIELLEIFLIGSLICSPDAASVFSILRSKKLSLKYRTSSLLELESGSNDPMAYMLTIALIQYITSASLGIGSVIWSFIMQFAIGGLVGFIIGKVAVHLINRMHLSIPSLYSLMLLSLIFFTFAITDIIEGNGYLAVYIAGIIVGNKKIVYKKEITRFLDGMTTLVQLIMFLSLGLLVNPEEMIHVIPIAVLIGIFMIMVGRPASVFLTLLPFKNVNIRSKLFVSWVGLRGAVPIIFATYPVVAGIEFSDQIFNIVFVITLMSLIVQGMSITSIAKMLHLIKPEDESKKSIFGMELPEEINAILQELTLTKEQLEQANQLKDMTLPPKTLVIMVKRGNKYLVPNGTMELLSGDRLLMISEDDEHQVLISE